MTDGRKYTIWVITGWWDTYILKAFSERFGFDALRISQIQASSQKQSNENAPWDVEYCTHNFVGFRYIH